MTLRYLLTALVTAVLVWFGTGLNPLWPLMWIAPLPVLLLPLESGALAVFLVAFGGWFLGGLNMAHYLGSVLETPVFIPVLAAAGPALIFALSVRLWRMHARCGNDWLAAFTLPVVNVAGEIISSTISIHSTFGSYAYTQMNALPVIQIASITGVAGIVFTVLLIPSAIATRRRPIIAAAVATVILVLAYGAVRLGSTPASPTVTVGLASSDDRVNVFPSSANGVRHLAATYATAADQLAAQGARLIVIPEKLAKATNPADIQAFDQPLAQVAASHHVELAAGLERWSDTDGKRNEVRLYGPDGRVEALYEKHHMLPPFESHLVVGTERLTFPRPGGTYGVTICKDMDFPKLSREYGTDGTGLLIVPAWDFVIDGWIHGRMAVLRGVESGFTIVRAAKQGTLTVSDDRGRVLAEQSTGASPVATLIAQAPIRHTATIYAATGDWFAWANVALVLLLLFKLRA